MGDSRADKYWFLRGTASIILLLLIPTLCLILHFIVFDLSPWPFEGSRGGLEFPDDLERPSLPAAVPFKSYVGTTDVNQPWFNVSVFFGVQNGCRLSFRDLNISEEEFKEISPKGLAIDGAGGCFPEATARVALHEFNFSFVIFEGPFKNPGYSAVSVFLKSNAPIPIYEVDFTADFKSNWIDGQRVNLHPTRNPLYRGQNIFVLATYAVLTAFLGALQTFRAADRMRGHVFANIKKINTRGWTSILQTISGLLRLVFCVDLAQVFHLFSFSFFRVLLSLAIVFIFSTIYLVAVAYHSAMNRIANPEQHAAHTRSFWIAGLLIFTLIIFELYTSIQLSRLAPATGLLVIIATFNAIAVQLATGIYFFYMKTRVIASMRATGSAAGKVRVAEVSRMSAYLFVSIVPMVGFILSLVLNYIFFINRSPTILPLALAGMFASITELTFICSFPKRPVRPSMMQRISGNNFSSSKPGPTQKAPVPEE